MGSGKQQSRHRIYTAHMHIQLFRCSTFKCISNCESTNATLAVYLFHSLVFASGLSRTMRLAFGALSIRPLRVDTFEFGRFGIGDEKCKSDTPRSRMQIEVEIFPERITFTRNTGSAISSLSFEWCSGPRSAAFVFN